MTKRSGFAVKITAFIEASATDVTTMQTAIARVLEVTEALREEGFLAVKSTSKFMLSREVPDAVAGTSADDRPFYCTYCSIDWKSAHRYGSHSCDRPTGPLPGMPPLPTALRRT